MLKRLFRDFGAYLAQFFVALANRPPVLYGALSALLVTLGVRAEGLEPYRELILLAIPPLCGYLASRLTYGPQTGKRLEAELQKAQGASGTE